MFQEDFGARLRELRLAKGLTKEDFCNGDELLCVRQLTRLETGKSQPKLETLTLLAQRLEMTVSELIGETETKTELPAEYLKLKYQLLRTVSYGEERVLSELDESLNTIFEKYYDDLPEEEQFIVEILQSKLYTYTTDGEYFGKSILDDYLPRLLQKEYYSINDFLILDLYQSHIEDEDLLSEEFNLEIFNTLNKKALDSIECLSGDYLFKARDVLLYIPYAEFIRNDFYHSEEALVVLHHIMEQTQDYQQKPLVKMLEWQYLLGAKHDKIGAEKCYQEATTLARLFGNDFLVGKLDEEWEKDTKCLYI